MTGSFQGIVRRSRRLMLAATLFAAIFVLRIADERPGDAILILCVVPVVLCALDRGPRGGVVASLVSLALTALWALSEAAEAGAVGYAARAAAFLVVGVVVGRHADQARARQRQLERSYRAAVELWCAASPDGYFQQLNPAWSELLGYSDQELRGRPFLDFVHLADRERTSREAARVVSAEGLTVNFENRYRTRDGDYCWLAWTARYVRADGLIYASA